MGVCEDGRRKNNDENINISKGIPYIKCTYDTKNFDLVQLINNKGETGKNEEIESKIKIWNGDKKEPLVFQKQFYRLGIKIVYFIN